MYLKVWLGIAVRIPWEDIKWVEFVWEVVLVSRVPDRHRLLDVAHDEVVDGLGQLNVRLNVRDVRLKVVCSRRAGVTKNSFLACFNL